MARHGKPPSVEGANRRGIQSVEKASLLLEALVSSREPLTLKELGSRADMVPSKAHRYLASLIRAGLVRQEHTSGRYDFGNLALTLGLAAMSRFDILERGHEALRSLSEETGLTSLFCVWGPMGPTIIRWQRGEQHVMSTLALGSVLPLLRSATGQAFLAYLPASLTKELSKAELSSAKRYGAVGSQPTTQKEVGELVRTVRDLGMAWVDGTTIPGLRAIAAPVLDAQGEASATITLIGTSPYITNPEHPTAKALKRVTDELSLAQLSFGS